MLIDDSNQRSSSQPNHIKPNRQMSKSEDTENIYSQLPRFVSEPDENGDKKHYLPAITRNFDYQGSQLEIVIMPASVRDQNRQERQYYPGEREEIVELALREFAVEENPNFIKKKLALIFKLRHFAEQLVNDHNDHPWTVAQIELSLQILAGVTYWLTDGKAEMYMRPVEMLDRVEENEEIYYCLQFSHIFMGDDQVFNYCFRDKNYPKPD